VIQDIVNATIAFENKKTKKEKRAEMLTTTFHSGEIQTSRGCNCKKSKCLKKYCECFFTNKYCNPMLCRCTSCCNFEGSEKLKEAIQKKHENERKEMELIERRETRNQHTTIKDVRYCTTDQMNTHVSHCEEKYGCLEPNNEKDSDTESDYLETVMV